MKTETFIVQHEFICDACGETVRIGERAVAESNPEKGVCRMRHENCPLSRPVRRRTPLTPVRTVYGKKTCKCRHCHFLNPQH